MILNWLFLSLVYFSLVTLLLFSRTLFPLLFTSHNNYSLTYSFIHSFISTSLQPHFNLTSTSPQPHLNLTPSLSLFLSLPFLSPCPSNYTNLLLSLHISNMNQDDQIPSDQEIDFCTLGMFIIGMYLWVLLCGISISIVVHQFPFRIYFFFTYKWCKKDDGLYLRSLRKYNIFISYEQHVQYLPISSQLKPQLFIVSYI